MSSLTLKGLSAQTVGPAQTLQQEQPCPGRVEKSMPQCLPELAGPRGQGLESWLLLEEPTIP